MTKYDFETDLGSNTSTGIILSKVPSHSIVLEFGCAAGRMTRYMKYALDCQVYIVEYDKEAFESAMQYAVDGVCDDILTLSWLDKFKDIRFDVILFADVLEHLAKPKEALANAAQLLKEQGRIFVSIPNIAHNDILLKAFNNRFDYTDIGLLDNTHVHFWGYENIIPFAEDSGLSVFSIEATYLPTGESEQFANTSFCCPPLLLNYFNERQFAEAYQFIIELGRKMEEGTDPKTLEILCKKNAITSHLYVDDGSGFNAENVISFASENTTPGRYVVHYVFDNTAKASQLRFDPLEYQGCVIQNLSVRQTGKELEYVCSDCLKFSEGIWMFGTDPMVLVKLPENSEAVVIDADILIHGEEYLRLIQQACTDKQIEIQSLNQRIEECFRESAVFRKEMDELNAAVRKEADELNAGNIILRSEIERLNTENTRWQKEAEDLSKTNKGLLDELERIRAIQDKLNGESKEIKEENEQLRREIGGYIRVSNEKDRLLLEQDSYVMELEKQVGYYKNRLCIKLLDRFWKVYWAFRLKLRRVIRKRTKDV